MPPSDATVYVGGLDEKVSEPLLWELFLQAGPVVNTHMPKDRVTGQHQGEGVPGGLGKGELGLRGGVLGGNRPAGGWGGWIEGNRVRFNAAKCWVLLLGHRYPVKGCRVGAGGLEMVQGERGKGAGGVGQHSPDQEPAACPGGQEGQRHPGCVRSIAGG